MKPTLLFYGNCQAGALAVIFGSDPKIAAAYKIVHLPTFDDPVLGSATTESDVISAAAFLFEQHDPVTFPQREMLAPDCVTVTYPAIDLNLLWPFNCVNIYNDPPTPESPWGRFPYGDAFIIDCVKRGLSARETTVLYEATAAEHLPNLDRFAKIERARLAARDSKCDISMADYIMDTFRHKNLFWSVNHPTLITLTELAHRVIDRANDASPVFDQATLDDAIAALPQEGPLGVFRIPVHPQVARHFDLRWYPDPRSPVYGASDTMVPYSDYLLELATAAVTVRDRDAVSSTQS